MLVKIQFPSGRFDEMAEHLANDPRLQQKFGFRIVTIPETVEELKKEIELKKEPLAENKPVKVIKSGNKKQK